VIAWIDLAGDARFESKIRRALLYREEVESDRDGLVLFAIESWGFGGFRNAYASLAAECAEKGLDAIAAEVTEESLANRLLASIRRALPPAERTPSRPRAGHRRRAAAVAHFIRNSRSPSAWKELKAVLDGVSGRAGHGTPLARWRKAFSRFLSGHRAVVGDQTLDILFANALLPFGAARARFHHLPDVEKRFYECYAIARRLPANRVERAAGLMIFGPQFKQRNFRGSPGGTPSTFRFQQGLHRLYEDFCSDGPEGCRRCPIPVSFSK
jgi:hypothetical protein